MTNDQIKAIALASGFKLKEQPNGDMDLNPYVYDFANKVAAQVYCDIEPHAAKDEQTIAALRAKVSEQAGEILRLQTNASNAINCLNDGITPIKGIYYK